jgi:hypothetical protein
MRVTTAAIAGAMATAAFIGGVGLAVGSDTTLYACVHNKAQTIKMTTAAKACPSGYTKLSWNTAGPKGDTGTQGPKGEVGPAGPKGDAGPGGSPGAFTLVDAYGVSLGTIAFYSESRRFWIVWTGTEYRSYLPNGEPALNFTNGLYWSGTLCSGTPYFRVSTQEPDPLVTLYSLPPIWPSPSGTQLVALDAPQYVYPTYVSTNTGTFCSYNSSSPPGLYQTFTALGPLQPATPPLRVVPVG